MKTSREESGSSALENASIDRERCFRAPFIRALKDDQLSEADRVAAAESLAAAGRGSSAAAHALARTALKENANHVGFSAGLALCRIGAAARKTLPILIETLTKAAEPETRRDAADTIGWIYCAQKAAPALINALLDEDIEVRTAAARTLEGLKLSPRNARKAAPVLTGLLDANPPSALKSSIISILAAIGSTAVESVPQLVRIVSDTGEESIARAKASEALGRIGEGAKEAAPVLIQCLYDTDQRVQQCAAQALLHIFAGAPDELRNLAYAAIVGEPFQSSRKSVYRTVHIALLLHDPDTIESLGSLATPALFYELSNPYLKEEADKVISGRWEKIDFGRIEAHVGPHEWFEDREGIEEAAHEALLNKDYFILEQLGAYAVPCLIDALRQGDPGVQEYAAIVMQRLSFWGDEHVAEASLIEALEDEDRQVASQAACLLARVKSGKANTGGNE